LLNRASFAGSLFSEAPVFRSYCFDVFKYNHMDTTPKVHLVRLGKLDTMAAIFPHSGEWVFVDDLQGLDLNVHTKKIEDHFELIPTHPLYSTVLAAVTCSDHKENSNSTPGELDTIILKITDRCNQACLHCYNAYENDVKSDSSIENLKIFVDESFEICGSSLNILFHGGEPLLRIDVIDEIAKYARIRGDSLGKRVGLFVQTNGSILNDHIIEILSHHDFAIGISLDGWANLHDQMRVMSNGTGTHRLFMRSYRKYKDFLIQNSGILTTVMAKNVCKLDEILLYVRDLGFRTWNTTLFDLNGRGELYKEAIVDSNLYCNSLEKILDLIENGELNDIAVKPILRHLDNLFSYQRFDMCLPGNNPCGAGNRLLSLSTNGTIFGCDIIHDHSLKLGKFPGTTLNDVRKSENATTLYTKLRHLPYCNNCTWLGVCGGTCFARRRINAVDPVYCSVSKQINVSLLIRMAKSNKLIDWYECFPPNLRRASAIWNSRSETVKAMNLAKEV